MGRKAYLNEYKLKEKIINGKVKREVVYIGEYYHFKMEPQARKTLARKLLLLQILAFVVFIAPLCMVNNLSFVSYTIIPHICLALPMWLMGWGLFQAAFAKEPMQHELADKSGNRFTWGLWIATILSGVDTVGSFLWILAFSDGKATGNDWIFALCAMLYFAAMWVFMKHKNICKTVCEIRY